MPPNHPRNFWYVFWYVVKTFCWEKKNGKSMQHYRRSDRINLVDTLQLNGNSSDTSNKMKQMSHSAIVTHNWISWTIPTHESSPSETAFLVLPPFKIERRFLAPATASNLGRNSSFRKIYGSPMRQQDSAEMQLGFCTKDNFNSMVINDCPLKTMIRATLKDLFV